MGNRVVDNVIWVENNLKDINPDDVQSVFRYVTSYHPNFGCTTLEPKNWNGTESNEILSKHADAVTVKCVNKLGMNDFVCENIKAANSTGISNCAYIAIHHKDEHIRNKFIRALDIWRDYKIK